MDRGTNLLELNLHHQRNTNGMRVSCYNVRLMHKVFLSFGNIVPPLWDAGHVSVEFWFEEISTIWTSFCAQTSSHRHRSFWFSMHTSFACVGVRQPVISVSMCKLFLAEASKHRLTFTHSSPWAVFSCLTLSMLSFPIFLRGNVINLIISSLCDSAYSPLTLRLLSAWWTRSPHIRVDVIPPSLRRVMTSEIFGIALPHAHMCYATPQTSK